MPPMANPDDIRMSLGDHLEDLRKRLFFGLVGPILFAIGLMFVAHRIVSFLCVPLLVAMKKVGQTPQVVMPQVGDAFGIYLRVALIGGIILGIPWLLWHLWQFIAPGLYPHERKYVVALMPGSAVLATVGVVFMYYVMLPFTLWFLVGFASIFPFPDLSETPVTRFIPGQEIAAPAEGETPTLILPQLQTDPPDPAEGQVWLNVTRNQISVFLNGVIRRVPLASTGLVTPQLHISEYISFVMWMALAFAVAFQLPLVMLALGFTGLVTYAGMASARKYALLGGFATGALLTPPDIFSQMAMAIPLYLLYEFGLLLVRFFVGRGEESRE